MRIREMESEEEEQDLMSTLMCSGIDPTRLRSLFDRGDCPRHLGVVLFPFQGLSLVGIIAECCLFKIFSSF